MMRSLYAGVSGLKNHQTRMDVIGNNISNVNTIGYKKSRVTFQDTLSQTLRGASSPQNGKSGTNPMQVGLGMTLASIDVIQTGGSPQSTGKNTDLSIEGEGFFLVSDGSRTYYTRAGNFDFDYNKTMYNTSNGMVVKGILADDTGYIDPKGLVVDINLASQVSSPAKATSNVEFSKNLDFRAESLTATSAAVTKNAGSDATIDLSANFPIAKVEIAGLLEGTDFTFNQNTGIVTILDGGPNVVDGTDYTATYYTPNFSVPKTVFDSLGNTHLLTVYYTKVGDNTWEVDTTLQENDTSTETMLNDGKGLLTFSPTTGALTSSTVTHATATIPGVDPLNIALDFSKQTEYAGDFTAIALSQDGYAAGSLDSLSVDATGTITGSFDNGQNRKLAQLVIATFPNPSGLARAGNNLFEISNNSGDADIGIPGVSGRGIIQPETLEMSNVDLSQEFVDMIITQRGFQANSRVITTSDQILEELVNLRR